MKKIPSLFEKKEDCCGCGACLNVCPAKAIIMREDEFGYIYPFVDENKCIRCGRCVSVCAFQKREETNSPIVCFAAVNKNKDQAKKSASAGIFAAIAKNIIERGGIVYGAAFDEKWGVHHIAAEQMADLELIQGSKYAHSCTERTFTEAKYWLKKGREVLYSGTPCQIAGFKEYLGREYDNLLTIDVVCHGVPSCKMLRDWLNLISEKNGGKIDKFTFRDKRLGWGINGTIVVNRKTIKIWQSASSFLYYFTKGWIFRENCYRCKYASSHRPADITVCDYWGIEKQHPELIGKVGWNESNGISAIIVNTAKGEKYCSKGIDLKSTSFERISSANPQLKYPSAKGIRDEILELYANGGWWMMEKKFEDSVGYKKYKSMIKSLVPSRLKRMLKRLM